MGQRERERKEGGPYPKALFPGALQKLDHLKWSPLFKDGCNPSRWCFIPTVTFELRAKTSVSTFAYLVDLKVMAF